MRSEGESEYLLTKAEVLCLGLAKGVLDISSFLSKVDDTPVRAAIDRLHFVWHECLRAVENGARGSGRVLLLDLAPICLRAAGEEVGSGSKTSRSKNAYLKAKARMELGSSSRTRMGLSAKM